MAFTVQLKDIVEALEMQFDEASSFLDLDTGKVETVSQDLLSEAEESDDDEQPDLPDWQKPEWEIAKRIVSTDRFKSLPTKYDVHEWEIMRKFADSVESEKISEELLRAIHGAGAFRYFKDTLRRCGIEKKWFEFREEALKTIAREWCEDEGVAWE
jgi:hypothetical protein